jgi:hypothetical protein
LTVDDIIKGFRKHQSPKRKNKKARQTSKPNRAPIKKKKGSPIITGAKVKSNDKI